MKVIVVKDYAAMSREAANVIAACVKENPACRLGLATGSTPEGLYAELVGDYKAGQLDFSQVTTFNLDEYRGLDNDHEQSYHYFMKKNLFDAVNIDPVRTHVPDGANPNAAVVCARYEAAIDAAGGIDLQLLGIGHNGHIGFNEPGTEFPKLTSCVDLAESTIFANSRLFSSADEVPRQAYTMGIGTIMKAKKILVVASGAGKATVVRNAFFGPVTPFVPASVLQLHHDVTLVVDEEAASLLEGSVAGSADL
ncbi:MAG: glucosamine-6-phosphate deaminase [Eggerthellaceae bacterium]|jgi:glucosamine-6-phosphate deaminase|nr:glucosamine-6-phosphate deaminase [Eggerthellaceae bacterium]MDR2715501.1 glucosamine-6-phosphate deaminase [Coriobacteriaceae bacterium]